MGGGGRRKETKVKEKSIRLRNVDSVIYVIITNHSRYILLDAIKYINKPDINV